MAVKVRNYSTKIVARASLDKINSMLVEAGALDVHFSYEDRRCTGISFALDTEIGRQEFRAPIDLDKLHAKLEEHWRKGEIPRRITDLKRVERIALRNIVDWLHVSLTLWGTGMYSPAEALFGFMVNPVDGQRIFDATVELLALPAPEGGS